MKQEIQKGIYGLLGGDILSELTIIKSDWEKLTKKRRESLSNSFCINLVDKSYRLLINYER